MEASGGWGINQRYVWNVKSVQRNNRPLGKVKSVLRVTISDVRPNRQRYVPSF
jgi:hypothetical protein